MKDVLFSTAGKILVRILGAEASDRPLPKCHWIVDIPTTIAGYIQLYHFRCGSYAHLCCFFHADVHQQTSSVLSEIYPDLTGDMNGFHGTGLCFGFLEATLALGFLQQFTRRDLAKNPRLKMGVRRWGGYHSSCTYIYIQYIYIYIISILCTSISVSTDTYILTPYAIYTVYGIHA